MSEDPIAVGQWQEAIEPRDAEVAPPWQMKHIFPEPVPVVRVATEDVVGDKDALSGWCPEHLAVAPEPVDDLPAEIRTTPERWTRPPGTEDDLAEGTSLFAPDTRQLLAATSYPWSTCGRTFSSQLGHGSGVMVGPRHMLTASHCIHWLSPTLASGLSFTPCAFDASAPFGTAQVKLIYYYYQSDAANGLNAVESAFDFVVCVLDRRLGMRTGWMGSRTYDPGWNGQSLWTHVGYPGDKASGLRPYLHRPGAIDTAQPVPLGGISSYRLEHEVDVWPGQSGGPYFGWWAGEPGPQVVCCQSGENKGSSPLPSPSVLPPIPPGPNTAAGGGPLVWLIIQGHTAHP